jgi:pimeloyl-ACP methyl ester carboxylesterase
MNPSPAKSDFVQVNGIRLHYLDWGGKGPALIFLAGMGSSAYIFSQFAPRFTDRFRVLALTRRGHGDSEVPETGYDADTLIEDIRQFMDQLNISTAILAGHSLAGVELTHFAATYPGRVDKLVYLDALDDRREEVKVMAQNPLRQIKMEKEESTPRTLEEYIANLKRDVPSFAEIWSEVWDEEISHSVTVNENGVMVDRMPEFVERAMVKHLVHEYAPKPVKAEIPILTVYVQKKPRLSDLYTEKQKAAFAEFHREVAQPFFWSLLSEFQSRFPHANIMVIPAGHHYCFLAQEELVYREMQRFLLA